MNQIPQPCQEFDVRAAGREAVSSNPKSSNSRILLTRLGPN